MERKKLIIIVAVVLFIVILVIILRSKKKTIVEEPKLPVPVGEVKTLENVKYTYNESTKKYTVYDENNNELGTVVSEEEVKKFVDNPNYDVSKRPRGFYEDVDSPIDENMLE